MVKKSSSGLTLTELLIVVSIIILLAVIALTMLRGQQFKGNDAKRKADIKKIQIAAEEYEKDHDCYPLPQLVTCNPGTGLSPYIEKIPCDPTTNASYYYEYQDSACPAWYKIYSNLENEADTDILWSIGPAGSYNYVAGSPNSPSDTGGTPPPSGSSGGDEEGGGIPQDDFYGCMGGVCVPISWDPDRPGPACDPNYKSPNCYGQCGPIQLECTSWD